MALILNIETATNICSVALALDGTVLSLRENNEGQSHAKFLTTLITDCFSEANVEMSRLQAIAVSKGPGSFTGLRIGVASAKGLCYALDIPLLGVNTLQSMASTLKSGSSVSGNTLLCPMIDARRMEVYSAVFNPDLEFVQPTSAMIIDKESFRDLLEKNQVIFFGDGMKKTIQMIGEHKNAVFFDDFVPSASGMVNFSENSYNLGLIESIAFFEPFYLKDFYTLQQPL